MCDNLSIDPDEAGMPPELRQLISAFKNKLTDALDVLKHANLSNPPRYDDLILGPYVDLYNWLRQYGRRRDFFRVSIKGLKKFYSMLQDWKDKYSAWPDDWEEDLLLVIFEDVTRLSPV